MNCLYPHKTLVVRPDAPIEPSATFSDVPTGTDVYAGYTDTQRIKHGNPTYTTPFLLPRSFQAYARIFFPRTAKNVRVLDWVRVNWSTGTRYGEVIAVDELSEAATVRWDVLEDVVSVSTFTKTRNEMREIVKAWSSIGSVFARVVPAIQVLEYRAGIEADNTKYMVFVRPSDDVLGSGTTWNKDVRFTWEGKTLEPVSAPVVGEEGGMVQFVCEIKPPNAL